MYCYPEGIRFHIRHGQSRRLMDLRNSLLILVSIVWHWRTDAAGGDGNANVISWRISVANQSELDQFMNNVTASNDEGTTNNVHLTLAGDNSYVLDIVKLMRINITDSSLVMESKGGPAEINCTANETRLRDVVQPCAANETRLRDVVQPMSRASLVKMDGLIFTGCPVPIMIEDTFSVKIRNCVFQHHEHGALNIYNSMNITLKNCKFHNNTSNGSFTTSPYQGSAGGCSIGYNNIAFAFTVPSLQDGARVLITNCNFTDNSARIPASGVSTSVKDRDLLCAQRRSRSLTDVLTPVYKFNGRGGGLAVLVNIDIPLFFKFTDNIVMNNCAEAFGGGVYCITRRHSNQTYRFSNSTFVNNRGPKAGGLALVYLLNTSNTEFTVHSYVYNCKFYDNTASEIAGAAVVSAVYGLASNIFVTFKECNFSNNAAKIYGGAVDIASYDFFDNIENQSLVNFHNCTFEGNVAADGAAMNLIRFGTRLYNVTFKDNKQSAVRMIGCLVQIHDEVNFVGNEAKNGGALYIISFGQVKVYRNTTITFENNTGQIGASIVVLSRRFSQAPPYNHPLYNPLCFLLHHNLQDPFTSVSNFKLKFIDNNASEATAIFLQAAQQCSWKGNTPPYFDAAYILNWKFLKYGDRSNTSQNITRIESSISHINVADVGCKYPGERFPLTMNMTDEMNQLASGFLQLGVKDNNQSIIKYRIYPPVVYYQSSKPRNVMIMVVIKNYTRSNYGDNVTITVKEFLRDNESISSNFNLSVVPCSAGFELAYNSTVNGFTCQHYRGNLQIDTCENDHTILLLADGQWGLNLAYTEKPGNLTVYPCPPGYCRCFQNLCTVGDEICNYAYFNDDPDKQCNCDREGYLCGDCKDSKGVSTLLNRCVDCGGINVIFIAVLLIVDATLIIVMLCKDFSFSALLFPTIFFINIVSYVGESYPTSYDQVGQYVYFINSLLSFYFPYDFCLYSGATPLAIYTFRYIPICLTIIICSIGLKLHQYVFKRVKRFSWNNLWLLLTLQYSHVVYTSMTILHCPQVINENGEYESRWFVKGTMECFTGYHIPLALCAIIVLVICTLLIPFLGLVATGKLTKPYAVRKLTKHLQHSFKENLPWWCVVELGRKLVFLLLLIPFPQNTAPPMLILMITFALYAYVLPYKEMFVNVIELLFQSSLLMFLLLRSTNSIVDKYLRFPNRSYGGNMDTTKCSSETGVANLTWILLPFAYLPLVIIMGIISVKMLLRLWKCIWDKYIKENLGPLWQEKSSTSYHVNISNTKYLLLGFEDNSIALVDAAAATDR